MAVITLVAVVAHHKQGIFGDYHRAKLVIHHFLKIGFLKGLIIYIYLSLFDLYFFTGQRDDPLDIIPLAVQLFGRVEYYYIPALRFFEMIDEFIDHNPVLKLYGRQHGAGRNDSAFNHKCPEDHGQDKGDNYYTHGFLNEVDEFLVHIHLNL